MIVLGLTGSIGMGKSTVSQMFRDFGVPVYDADAVVHQLYAKGGAAVPHVEAAFPGVAVDGAIDRARLSQHVIGKPEALRRLEKIVHPLTALERGRFRQEAHLGGAPLVVLDIPLLLEGRVAHTICDKVAVVSAPGDVQRARVLARPGMTPEKLDAILAKQMPDAEKRGLAHYIIPTGTGLDETRAAVADVIADLTGKRP